MTFPNLGFPTFPQFQQPTEGRNFFLGGKGFPAKIFRLQAHTRSFFGYHFAKKRNGKEMKRKKKDIFLTFWPPYLVSFYEVQTNRESSERLTEKMMFQPKAAKNQFTAARLGLCFSKFRRIFLSFTCCLPGAGDTSHYYFLLLTSITSCQKETTSRKSQGGILFNSQWVKLIEWNWKQAKNQNSKIQKYIRKLLPEEIWEWIQVRAARLEREREIRAL